MSISKEEWAEEAFPGGGDYTFYADEEDESLLLPGIEDEDIDDFLTDDDGELLE